MGLDNDSGDEPGDGEHGGYLRLVSYSQCLIHVVVQWCRGRGYTEVGAALSAGIGRRLERVSGLVRDQAVKARYIMMFST